MDVATAGEQRTKGLSKWDAWDDFLDVTARSSFLQSAWYANFRAAYCGWRHFGTVLKDKVDIVGGCVVLAKTFAPEKCYYYVPDGPVILDDDSDIAQEQVFNTIMEFIERKRRNEGQVVSHLGIDPRWERVPGFVKGFQEASIYYGLPRATQIIDLSLSENDILSQMKQKGRYNIGVARRYDVSVVEDVSEKGINDFLEIYQDTFDRKKINGNSPEYFSTLIPILAASKRGSVFFAEYQGIRLATALVVYFGDTATYYHGGSRAAHRNVMAPYLLHFEIMRRAKSLGYQCYDLFGVTPQGNPSDGWTDISAFKRKLGGRERLFVPTLELIYDPVAYQEWKAIEEAEIEEAEDD